MMKLLSTALFFAAIVASLIDAQPIHKCNQQVVRKDGKVVVVTVYTTVYATAPQPTHVYTSTTSEVYPTSEAPAPTTEVFKTKPAPAPVTTKAPAPAPKPQPTTTKAPAPVTTKAPTPVTTKAPAPQPTEKPTKQPAPNAHSSQSGGWKQEMLSQLNAIRSDAGKPPLKLKPELSAIAQKHSQYMDRTQDMTHSDPQGGLGSRYSARSIQWSGAAENIAWNQPTVSVVMEAWRNSPGHYANMIGDYTYVGFGQDNLYWTQDFLKA